MKIFKLNIQGINTNIKKGNSVYHIQTEVLYEKQIVISQAFKNGKITKSFFKSYKKYFNELYQKNPEKFIKGIRKMVDVMHKKMLFEISKMTTDIEIIHEEKIIELFKSWNDSVMDNIYKEFGKNVKMFQFIKKTDTSKYIFLKSLKLHLEIFNSIQKFFNENIPIAFFTFTDTQSIFSVFLNEYLSTFVFDNENFLPGFVKMEMKKYLLLLREYYLDSGKNV